MAYNVELQTGEGYALLTSTRWDPFLDSCRWNDDDEGPQPFFLLRNHLERLISAAEAHEWPNAQSALTYFNLKTACTEAVSVHRKRTEGRQGEAIRLRITVSKVGPNYLHVTTATVVSFSSDPTLLSFLNPLPQPEGGPSSPIRIYLDTEATIPSIFTRTKTTYRKVYDLAKQRNEAILGALPSEIDSDILFYNQRREIMETTIFNVAFYRNSQWVTPAARSGCLCGVMRRWLLERGRIREDVERSLTKDAIFDDDWALLFNGVQGCRIGKLCLASAPRKID